MDQVEPGIFQWNVSHPQVPMGMRSTFLDLAEGRVLIDANVPHAGIEAISSRAGVDAVIVTNPYHVRDCLSVATTLGAPLWVPRKGPHFWDGAAPTYKAASREYGDGDILPGGLRAISLNEMPHGEMALHRRGGGGLLVFSDALLRDPAGNLMILSVEVLATFFPSEEAARAFHAANRLALRRVRGLGADVALFGHGDPLVRRASTTIDLFIAAL